MILSHPLSGRLTHRTSTQLTTPCGVCFKSKSIVPRSRTSTNWNDASSASGLLWVTRLLTLLLKTGDSVYALALMLEADIVSTRWNEDCVMWHVPQCLFWETITVSLVCCYSVNHLNGDKYTFNYCLNGSIWHFKFSKVVRAHTLGEVDILGTVLLRVSSGTILTIFIVIGSYLTDREQKISWHSFFETRCTSFKKAAEYRSVCGTIQKGPSLNVYLMIRNWREMTVWLCML